MGGEARRAGRRTKGPPKRKPEDNARFEAAFVELLQQGIMRKRKLKDFAENSLLE